MTVPTEVKPEGGFLNDPIHLPNDPPPAGHFEQMEDPQDTASVAAKLAAATASPEPEMSSSSMTTFDLPTGWVNPDGILVKTARVRELNGYDEEHLARVDMQKNVAVFITELLAAGVEDLGGSKPTKDTLREMLSGDRDALLLGVRRATYGDLVEFKITCAVCDTESIINIELDKDIKIIYIDDPLVRKFEVPIGSGFATIKLLDGKTQEAFSENVGKKTQAQINTILLANTVIAVNGIPTAGREDPVKMLGMADRAKILKYLEEHQPGPQFGDIPVNCATCGEEYPITLGLPSLFRL